MDAAGPKPVDPLTLILGTEGVIDVTVIEGALIVGAGVGAGDVFMEMVGMFGVTEIAGTLAFTSLRGAGVSLTEIVGIGGVTPIDGTFAVDPA